MTYVNDNLFSTLTYQIHKSVERISLNEKITIPPYQEEKRYHAIDENGIPLINTYVKKGDCIIGKIRVDKSTNNIIDVSTYLKSDEEGEIDKIDITNYGGIKVVSVRMKCIKSSQVGDMYFQK